MKNKTMLAPIALLFLCTGGVHAANLLIYEPSVEDCSSDKGPVPCNEIEVAQNDGHSLTIVDESGWTALTQGQFAAFDAIVFGDGGCTDDEDVFDTVDANKSTWSPAVTGNVVIHTFDPFAHESSNPGAIELTSNGMNAAASGGSTGMYYPNGCRDDGFPSAAKGGLFTLPFLSEFGEFVLNDDSWDDITIVDPDDLVVAGTTDGELSGWGSSTHADFVSFPEEFNLVAVATGGGEKGGVPVLITRGERFVGAIPALSPVGLGLLGLLLAGLGATVMRRRFR